MIVDRSWEIEVESLRARPVDSARMLAVGRIGGPDKRAVVLDSASDEFVVVAGLPLKGSEPVSLSYDGRHLVGVTRGEDLYLYTLATGEQRWFTRNDVDGHAMAAMSPDGSCIAALTMVDADIALEIGVQRIAVELIDFATGQADAIWAGEGFFLLGESAIGWSPDGRLIAATYSPADDGLSCTMVVEAATGRVVGEYVDRLPMESPHGVWVSDDELFATSQVEDDAFLIRVDAAMGGSRETRFRRRIDDGYVGGSNRRVVRGVTNSPETDTTELYTTDLDDSDPRLFLTISKMSSIRAIDLPANSVR